MQTDGRAAANGGFIGERSELGEACQSAREAVAPRARPRPATAGAARGRGPESGVRTPVCKFFIYGFRFERTLPGPKPERHDTRGANMTRKLATHNTETAITNKSESRAASTL